MEADELRSIEFREQLRGYAPDDVDAFIENVVTRLESGRVVRRSDVQPTFRTARFRGYHRDDVDALLERLRRETR